MFWKKKKPETKIIRHETEELRQTYRYHFKEGQGFSILFKGKTVKVLDISAGGMSFKNQGFKPYDVDAIRFTLDVPNYKGNTSFSAELRILSIDEDHHCHCLFEQCSLEQYELIHKYVLEMQKNDLAH
ncbi:MAG: hypothetical protein A2277_18585 [Desulfobacterales bacterium RIFOXYA12_FULL_46_15]|nr:MAG: hypothetical protein A2277_18585 [Desulfobacterales bacterium RIFOXYA12_FULL_46_15]